MSSKTSRPVSSPPSALADLDRRRSACWLHVVAVVPQVAVASPVKNVAAMLTQIDALDTSPDIIVFPELAISSYTAGDTFLTADFCGACDEALRSLREATAEIPAVIVVGAPALWQGALFNVAIVMCGGDICGVVPKVHLPNHDEFSERRWFRSGFQLPTDAHIDVAGQRVSFSRHLLFDLYNSSDSSEQLGSSKKHIDHCSIADATHKQTRFFIEVCEDGWTPSPPSMSAVRCGAEVVLNLSSSNYVSSKRARRRRLMANLSERGCCAYVYCSSGMGESTSDVIFDGDAFIAEHGAILAENHPFEVASMIEADIDLLYLRHLRRKMHRMQERGVGQGISHDAPDAFHCIDIYPSVDDPLRSHRPVSRVFSQDPFVSSYLSENPVHETVEIIEAQAAALAARAQRIEARLLIIGMSGGLDSTWATLIAFRAADRIGMPRSSVWGVSLPGLATSRVSNDIARGICGHLGLTHYVISLDELSALMLDQLEAGTAESGTTVSPLSADVSGWIDRLKSEKEPWSLTAENVQARLRTTVLFSLANRYCGLSVGTGDLSEKALGWSTYGGDQLGMYDVNSGLPKTFIRSLLNITADTIAGETTAWQGISKLVDTFTSFCLQAPAVTQDPVLAVERAALDDFAALLRQVASRPITPELLPVEEKGDEQHVETGVTERVIGPYELHDFFIFHLLGRGATCQETLRRAKQTFQPNKQSSDGGAVSTDSACYTDEEIEQTFAIFRKRFTAGQYKRAASADGPKILDISLSSRSSLRLPSDGPAL